jgi:hypothetical protein
MYHQKFKNSLFIFLFTLMMMVSGYVRVYAADNAVPVTDKFIGKDGLSGFEFNNFYGAEKHLTLNGVAQFTLDEFSQNDAETKILRLTPRIPNAEGHIAGSAFVKYPYKAYQKGYPFSTFFRYRVTASNIFDGSGMVFMLQSDDRLDKAIGKCAYCMGYAGSPALKSVSIKPSVAVEFDIQMNTTDTDYNMVGLDLNGNLTSVFMHSGAFAPNGRSGISETPYTDTVINNGLPWNVWVDFDGKILVVRSSQSNKRDDATVHLRRPMNMSDILTLTRDKNEVDEPLVYVGFSADPGLYPAYTDVLEWHFRGYYKPYGDFIPNKN